MELRAESLEAACKLAYELGQQRAENDWELLTKEANWRQIGAELSGGVKGLFRGNATFAEGRAAGREALETARRNAGIDTKLVDTGTGGFKELAGYTGQQLAQPYKNLYQTFRAKRFDKAYDRAYEREIAADKVVRDLEAAGDKAAPGALEAARVELANAQKAHVKSYSDDTAKRYGFGDTEDAFDAARAGYFANLEGQYGNLAASAGLTAAGVYGANKLLGGSPQYNLNVTQQVQPQQAPHQYYLNQLSSLFK